MYFNLDVDFINSIVSAVMLWFSKISKQIMYCNKQCDNSNELQLNSN